MPGLRSSRARDVLSCLTGAWNFPSSVAATAGQKFECAAASWVSSSWGPSSTASGRGSTFHTQIYSSLFFVSVSSHRSDVITMPTTKRVSAGQDTAIGLAG